MFQNSTKKSHFNILFLTWVLILKIAQNRTIFIGLRTSLKNERFRYQNFSLQLPINVCEN